MGSRPTFGALAVLAVLVLALAACGGGDEAAEEATVQLSEQTGSGQSGTATLTPVGDNQTMVAVELSSPPDHPQPAHIHDGSCEELGGVAYGLNDLDGGTSETTVDVSLDDLLAGEYAINAHESEEAIEISVACGPINGTPAASADAPGEEQSPGYP
jgi:hypothetical protein